MENIILQNIPLQQTPLQTELQLQQLQQLNNNNFYNIHNTHNTHNTQNNYNNYNKKNVNPIDFKYICIKKDVFDVNMIYLNYSNIKKRKYIEIIYKSPSVFLEGLFFKSPPISSNDIVIFYKDKYRHNKHKTVYDSINNINNTTENITLKVNLNNQDHSQFIQILRNIDEYLSAYINKCAAEIESELITNYNDQRPISSFRYDQIVKYYYDKNTNTNQNTSNNTNTSNTNSIEMNLKSYLDKNSINELEQKLENKKYILTFNISNIYFGNNNLIPLVKCNKCVAV